jgi:hypothetical protein
MFDSSKVRNVIKKSRTTPPTPAELKAVGVTPRTVNSLRQLGINLDTFLTVYARQGKVVVNTVNQLASASKKMRPAAAQSTTTPRTPAPVFTANTTRRTATHS